MFERDSDSIQTFECIILLSVQRLSRFFRSAKKTKGLSKQIDVQPTHLKAESEKDRL